MMTTRQGDILQANAQALVNAVNCVGVMGRGIALQLRHAYPDNFRAYAQACRQGVVVPGQMFIHATGQPAGPTHIINFPTKRHWRDKSRLDDIETGLLALVAAVERLGIRTIAIPALGCGLGGLDWAVVRPRIERAFADRAGVEATLYEPTDTQGAPLRALARPR